MRLEGDAGARRLIDALKPGELVEIDAPGAGATVDIDTPGDLAAARQGLRIRKSKAVRRAEYKAGREQKQSRAASENKIQRNKIKIQNIVMSMTYVKTQARDHPRAPSGSSDRDRH